MSRLAVIAAGGTGGHMFPAQAFAEAMLARGWRLRLSTDARGARHAGGFPEAVARVQVSAATPARGGLAGRLSAPARTAGGVLEAAASMRRDRPDLVVGFGGYPSIPSVAAGLLLGVPTLIHEQNAVLGRANALFARRVAAVACGAWPTALPARARGVHTGNPVRAAVIERAGAPYVTPGEDGPLRALVFGGSQGAQILSRVVPGAFAALPRDLRARLRVAHQARPEDAEEAARVYREGGVEARIEPFFDDLPERLAACQLVVSRAGASSVADITTIGRPCILVPLAAAIRDEQTANAEPLVRAGAAVAIPEAALTPASLATHMRAVLEDPGRAFAMAAAARAAARPDAAETLADLAVAVADRRPITPAS